MAKKIINIRLEESVWQMAREDAVHNRMTLQDWVTRALHKAHSGKLIDLEEEQLTEVGG